MKSDCRQLMSDAKFFSDYARWLDTEKRYEQWDEAVDRVMMMHRNKYFNEITKHSVLSDEIQFAESMYKNKSILGAQRALQFGGDQIEKHNIKLYNCVSSYCDRVEFFNEYMYFLLGGCGAGFSVQRHHIKKLPSIVKRTKMAKIYVVEDSIEGWSDAIAVLLGSYFYGGGKFPEYAGRRVYFDLNNIRPKGAKISGGFKAPGPEPLRQALDHIEKMLEDILSESKSHTIQLKSIHVYDICMYCADAVIAGGVRRAATICLFSHDDEDMIKAKTGDWFYKNPQRGRSNNSAVILRGSIQWDEFQEIMKSVEEHGEPGFIFVDDHDMCCNPCVTGDTIISVKIDENFSSMRIDNVVDMFNDGHDVSVLARDLSHANDIYTPISAAALTHKNVKVIKITDTSSGRQILCTEDHKIWTENRGYVEARDLQKDDVLKIK